MLVSKVGAEATTRAAGSPPSGPNSYAPGLRPAEALPIGIPAAHVHLDPETMDVLNGLAVLPG